MEHTCGGTILDADGEIVCGRCGEVLGYGAEESPRTAPEETRRPTALLNFDKGLTAVMGRSDVDHTGAPCRLPETVKRLRTWDRRAQTYKRSVPRAMTQIAGVVDALGMSPACAEYAAYLYRKALAAGFLTGRTMTHVTAAAALLACRAHGMNRTVTDAAVAAGLRPRDVYRAYAQLHSKFDARLPVPDPASYVNRIGEECGVSGEARRDALRLLARADRVDMAGKDPAGLAAGALYAVCRGRGEPVARRDLAAAAGIAETTLASRSRRMAGAGPRV